MAVKQLNFETKIKKFALMEDARDDLWERARTLLVKGYEIEAYILILATWNFADFRFFLKNFNLRSFENTIKKLNPIFKKIENRSFQEVNFRDEEIRKDIKLVYSELKRHVRQTGTGKIMALKNPNLFVMWDTGIRKLYNIDNKSSPDDYVEFLEKMKEEFKDIKWQDKNRPLAKVIDEYNYVLTQEE